MLLSSVGAAQSSAADANPAFTLSPPLDQREKQPAHWNLRPGPWGNLSVRSLYLEAPQALIELAPKPDQISIWRFPGWSLGGIREFLVKAGLSAAELDDLLDSSHVRHEVLGPVLLPSPQFLIELAPEVRQAIYEELAKIPANSFHAKPLPLPGSVDDWLLGSKLSANQRALFKKLLWKRGDCHVFSDISLLISQAASGAEINAAISSQTRVQSLVLKFRVPAADHAEAILDYWCAGRANDHIMPFFRSTVDRESGSEIDLIYLLPRLARARLNTYPNLSDAVGGKLPDCHWTAVNFFAINYQPYYLDGRSGYLDLIGTHDAIPAPTRLGDLVCILRKDGTLVHSCVFVADDLVFTKNGEQIYSPWVLLRFADVAAIYAGNPGDRLAFLRLKPRAAIDL